MIEKLIIGSGQSCQSAGQTKNLEWPPVTHTLRDSMVEEAIFFGSCPFFSALSCGLTGMSLNGKLLPGIEMWMHDRHVSAMRDWHPQSQTALSESHGIWFIAVKKKKQWKAKIFSRVKGLFYSGIQLKRGYFCAANSRRLGKIYSQERGKGWRLGDVSHYCSNIPQLSRCSNSERLGVTVQSGNMKLSVTIPLLM